VFIAVSKASVASMPYHDGCYVYQQASRLFCHSHNSQQRRDELRKTAQPR